MKKFYALLLSSAFLLAACGPGPTQNNNNNIKIDISEKLLQALGKQDGKTETDTGSQSTNTQTRGSINTDTETKVDVSLELKKEIEQAIHDNANALNTRDLAAFSSSLHPSSQIQAAMPDIFYFLMQAQTSYNIVSIQIQSQSDTSATALVERRTTDLSGTINQQILYTLQKSGSQWKVFFMVDQSSNTDFDSGEFEDDCCF